jgi:hypothetical protein
MLNELQVNIAIATEKVKHKSNDMTIQSLAKLNKYPSVHQHAILVHAC